MADLLSHSCADASGARLNALAAYLFRQINPLKNAALLDPALALKSLRKLDDEVSEAIREIRVDLACEDSRRNGTPMELTLHVPTEEYVAASGVVGAPVQQSDRTGA